MGRVEGSMVGLWLGGCKGNVEGSMVGLWLGIRVGRFEGDVVGLVGQAAPGEVITRFPDPVFETATNKLLPNATPYLCLFEKEERMFGI